MTKNTERLSPDRQLSRQDVECLKEAFKLFDCDSNGRITVEELGKVNKLYEPVQYAIVGGILKPFSSYFTFLICTLLCFLKMS